MTLFSLADKIRCVEREINLRRRVYARWVSEGRMKPENAAHEIGCMEAVLADLRAVEASERLL